MKDKYCVKLLSLIFLIFGCSLYNSDYDIVIKNANIVDGTNSGIFTSNIAVRGKNIVRIADDIEPAHASEVINADGLVVSPGFIDHHAHIQLSMDNRPLAENFLRQGITTILATTHSGDQPWPFGEYLDQLEPAPNVGYFAGFNWTRERVIGMEDRPPTEKELERMKDLVEQTMQEGALGLSSGLRYIPGRFAEMDEVVELARVVSDHGGYYVSHIRNEGPGVVEAVREVVEIAERADLPGQVQHHKTMGSKQWGDSEITLGIIDSARAEGIEIAADVYPYTATSTGSSVLFPGWALAGGPDSLRARLQDPKLEKKIRAGVRNRLIYERGGGELERIQFRELDSYPEYSGRTMADLAEDRGMPINVETGVDLAIELQLEGGFSGIWHVLDQDDVERILKYEYTMINSDGDPVGYGNGHPHPRTYGAFPRVIDKYVQDLGVLELEEVIHRMTDLSAQWIGLKNRGRIEEGYRADIIAFDPEKIEDKATFTAPHQYSVGVQHMLVNGAPVIRDASLTGKRPGQVLRGPAK
jgi:N-acyl-D-aspartate/D-glutamate deacylase